MLAGSVVADTDNTSGLGTDAEPPLVAIYTNGTDDSQSLAYSTDHGQTWQQYSGNPVLDSGIAGEKLRDPEGLLVRAGWVLGAGRSRRRWLHRSAVQVEEPDELDLPERGHRGRLAGGPVGEPGPVPAWLSTGIRPTSSG